mgnify:CR=1 FL=1
MYKKIKEYIKIRYLLYILLFVLVFYGIYGICYQYMLSNMSEKNKERVFITRYPDYPWK